MPADLFNVLQAWIFDSGGYKETEEDALSFLTERGTDDGEVEWALYPDGEWPEWAARLAVGEADNEVLQGGTLSQDGFSITYSAQEYQLHANPGTGVVFFDEV